MVRERKVVYIYSFRKYFRFFYSVSFFDFRLFFDVFLKFRGRFLCSKSRVKEMIRN